jgi:hypothetical protein
MLTQPYILVDTTRNHLYIKRGDQVMLDVLASTGSGTIIVLSPLYVSPSLSTMRNLLPGR